MTKKVSYAHFMTACLVTLAFSSAIRAQEATPSTAETTGIDQLSAIELIQGNFSLIPLTVEKIQPPTAESRGALKLFDSYDFKLKHLVQTQRFNDLLVVDQAGEVVGFAQDSGDGIQVSVLSHEHQSTCCLNVMYSPSREEPVVKTSAAWVLDEADNMTLQLEDPNHDLMNKVIFVNLIYNKRFDKLKDPFLFPLGHIIGRSKSHQNAWIIEPYFTTKNRKAPLDLYIVDPSN